MKPEDSCLRELRGAVLVYTIWGALCALIAWPISAALGSSYLYTALMTMLAANLSIPIIGGPIIFIRNRVATRRLKRSPCQKCGEVPEPQAGFQWTDGECRVTCPGCGLASWVRTW